MKIIVNGRNIELTEAIKTYIHEKFSRLQEHFEFVQEVHVFLAVEKNPRIADSHVAEATIHVQGAVMRVEQASENLYASIDSLLDKVERSLRKHKTKLMQRSKKHRGDGGDSIRKMGFEEALAAEKLAMADSSEDELLFYYGDVDEDDEVEDTTVTSASSVER